MKEIIQKLDEIKKELQDIRSILEPKEVKTTFGNDVVIGPSTVRKKIGTEIIEETALYPKE